MKRMICIILPTLFLFGFSIVTHKNITDKAFDYLPEMMNGFRNKFQSPIINSLPPYYMLPDLEEPGHTLEKIAQLTEQYYNTLVADLEQNNINDAEQNIGRIAHLIGDAVSPTQNSSETWGEIDDYYDFQITDPYFDQIKITRLDQNGLIEIDNIYNFTLELCQSSTSHTEYLITIYNQYKDSPSDVFDNTKQIFDEQISIGIKALQDVLYTAWIEAGRPNYDNDPGNGGCSYYMLTEEIE